MEATPSIEEKPKINESSKDTPKTNSAKGLKLALVACALLALGGLAFGFYEMSQVKTVKQQISDLKIEVKNTDGSTTTLETDKIEVKEADKTVIISDSVTLGVSPFYPEKSLNSTAAASQICHQSMAGYFCLNSERTSVSVGTLSKNLADSYLLPEAGDKSYTFTASSGKIADFYVGSWGQSLGDETIFFIMDNGNLEYAPLRYAIKNNDFSAKKVENVSGIVKVVMINLEGGVNSAAVRADGSWYSLYSLIGGRDTVYYAL